MPSPLARKAGLKLDCLLLTWTFTAGILKEMDQDAATQAYVTGMREYLSLYGNELVWFQTYFSIGHAIFILPAQLVQIKVRTLRTVPGHEIKLIVYRLDPPYSCLLARFAGSFWYCCKLR